MYTRRIFVLLTVFLVVLMVIPFVSAQDDTEEDITGIVVNVSQSSNQCGGLGYVVHVKGLVPNKIYWVSAWLGTDTANVPEDNWVWLLGGTYDQLSSDGNGTLTIPMHQTWANRTNPDLGMILNINVWGEPNFNLWTRALLAPCPSGSGGAILGTYPPDFYTKPDADFWNWWWDNRGTTVADWGEDGLVVVTADDGIAVYGVGSDVYVDPITGEEWPFNPGYLAVSATHDELTGADTSAGNVLVAQSDDGYFRIYKLATGEYQVNVGPNWEGVERVLVMPHLSNVGTYTYEIR